MLQPYIKKLDNKQSLTQTEAYESTLTLLAADTNTQEIADFLLLLHSKGETSAEIMGVVAALKANMLTVPTPYRVLDIVGTGGDNAGTVNISTAAAILAASCGVITAKHGNRAVSSRAGSADVLEALGIDIDMPIEKITACLDQLHIGFCFAPRFHPGLARLRGIRRQLAVPTVFNLAGPLLNPAQAQHYLLGVFSPALLQPFADILAAWRVKKSVVVHSNGLDEITTTDLTQVIEVDDGHQTAYVIDPGELGFIQYARESLTGGDARENAAILRKAFAGEPGPVADAILINAGMALYLYGQAHNLMAGIEQARVHLLGGDALKLLERWRVFSIRER